MRFFYARQRQSSFFHKTSPYGKRRTSGGQHGIFHKHSALCKKPSTPRQVITNQPGDRGCREHPCLPRVTTPAALC
jgi:hypothetical protein